MKIAIGSDHAGFVLKTCIIELLNVHHIDFHDYGTFSEDSVDYPDIVQPLAMGIQNGQYQFGILLCGTGNGMAITANKYRGIRAALCWNPEITLLARQHNDANVLALPARFISENEATEMVLLFLSTLFEGGRHQKRIEKINQISESTL
jgi:ribose 5-phosphate isomerase B